MPVSSTTAGASRQRSRSQDAAVSIPNSLLVDSGHSISASPSRHLETSSASNSRSVSGSSISSDRSDRMASSTTSAALSARRPSTARSEASAKLKATLSAASSSDKASSQRGASGQQRSNSTSGQERASTNGSTAASSSTLSAATTPVRRTSAPDGNQARPPMQRSSTQDDSVPHTPLSHFRAEAANLPAIPLQAFAFTQSQNGVHSHTNNLEGTTGSFATGYLPSQMSAGSAPLMTSPSRSAPLPAANGSTTASNTTPSASPNGRVRSQTATPANATSPYSANGSNVSYHGSRSMRASPQMRALPQQHHGLVPSLQSLGASMLTSPSAASSGYGHSASMSATSPSHSQTHSGPHWERHTNELTSCVVAFLSPILPTEEEYRIKEATRRQLERLANRVSPGAKLLAFGSMANGFALRNSDMDLCCLMSKGEDGQPKTQHTASELVETLGQLIREETDFTVMPLPKARIPIIKITRSPTADLPYEIACDIGFENRLALENTRLLLSYAMVDPQRLRTLVLFIKVWAKRRKLNSPYTGTLSSYGYTLLVLFFLTHVKKPAVLPNLQRVPPTRIMKPEEMELNGNNIYFYDDVEELKKEWASENHENVGELLIDFFRYFSKEFSYARDVISLKSETGLLSKDSKSWNAELCIEDPFQMGYNVSRTVTKDGLYTIRGEFMRASRFLTNTRGQKISTLIAELCEEREDSLSRAPDGPGSMQRNPYHSYMGMGVPNGTSFYTASANGGRPYRDSNRRYDGNSISGYGGSFAFEQMARGLGQGVAYPPTAAMLAPLSRTHGLSPKPQHSRYAGASSHSTDAGTASFSSAQSDSGGYAPLDSAGRASIGHASARTSPSFKHAVPNGYHSSNGLGAQEAFAYGAEISFGAPSVASTRDDMGSTPRGKTSRSFSETLNRSKSLPRAPALANGHQRRAQGGASLMPHSQAGAIPTPAPATFYEPASPHSLAPSELESRMATLHVQQPSTSGPRRLSASSHASSSALFDSNSASTLHCSSASSPWSLGPAVTDGRRPSHHQQQADTHALVQEYLRRAAQSGAESTLPMDADKFAPRADHDDEDESGSVISEATLDELARLSELEGTDSSAGSPDWRGADAKQPAQREESPPRPMRLPESVLQQAKLRKHAQAAAAAAAAASSGIARKDRENAKLD